MKSLVKRRGQSTLEYAVLIVVIAAAVIIASGYVKRGMQGRLRDASDDIGDQFSPGALDGSLTTSSNRKYTENKKLGKTTTFTESQSQLTSGTVNMKRKLGDDLWPADLP